MTIKLPIPDGSPHRGVRTFEDYHYPIEESCDVCVVGSGPGGAVVAKILAEQGFEVVLLEEGRPYGATDFRPDAATAMTRMIRGGGTRVAKGRSFIPTMQAKAYGGGSVINSAICARAPEFTLESWGRTTGVSHTRRSLDPHYDNVEAHLGVQPTANDALGERNRRFKAGCDALGISSEPTHRNVQGCKASGECFSGCRNGAKKSTDVSFMPAAIKHGTRVYTSVRAERVVRREGVLRGIHGVTIDPFTSEAEHYVHVKSDVVVLASGCMQTPLILERSGLANRWCGADLQFHPGIAVMAEYEDLIDPWIGATQGYHSLHYIQEGIKLEALWAPPEILATRLPGIGAEYQRNLLRYGHYAPFDVITAANRSRGRVKTPLWGWEPDIRFDLHPTDMEIVRRGVAILSDICWASGAKAVLPGIHGLPEVLRSREEAEILRTAAYGPEDAIIGSNHAFGTTRMSRRAEDGVVNELGEHHGLCGLYVADSGIFAGSPGVNPMLTVMALADMIARHIAQRYC